MLIDSFAKYGVFEPEATAAMGEAFDTACEELHCASQPEVVRELIATLIISAANRGELNPTRLRLVASEGFAALHPRLAVSALGTQDHNIAAADWGH